jgi:rhodanese-related sulfurtransferase
MFGEYMKKYMFMVLAALVLASSLAAQGARITPKAARDLLAKDKNAILVDVRTLEEFVAGRIPASVLLPYDQIDATTAAKTIGPKDRAVIVYCRSGRRSQIAAAALKSLGYSRVYDLGSIGAWPYGTIQGKP